ncbi:MAG: tetratricopeptide repeat protein [Thermoguttaceae bacterium]
MKRLILPKQIFHIKRITFSFFAMFCFVLIGSSATLADEAAERFNAAKTAFDAKLFSQSQQGFQDFLTKFPTHAQEVEAKFYLAESFLNMQQYDVAEAYYNQIVAVGLNNPFARVALFRLGDIPYIRGKYDVAKPRLVTFVEKLDQDPNLQFVLYYLGDIAMRQNVPLESEHYFSQSTRMFPSGAKIIESQIGLAWAKNQLGKVTEANAIFQQLMQSSDPKVAEPATYQWGVAQFERGDLQGALTTLSNFQRSWPTSSYFMDSVRVMARCRGGLGDYNGALVLLNQLSPQTTEDILLKIRCLYGLDQTQEAQNLLAGIERTSGTAYIDEIALLKSVFLFDQNNWQGAISTLESVLVPQYNASLGQVSFAYMTLPAPLGGHKLADDIFLKACSLLAQSYAKNGDNNRADAILKEMNSTAKMLGRTDLQGIISDTQTQLTNIYASNKNRPGGGSGGQQNPQNPLAPLNTVGQWNPRNQNQLLDSLQVITSGTDLERFWIAVQEYDKQNWTKAAAQLDQVLKTQYNVFSKVFFINYQPTGRNQISGRDRISGQNQTDAQTDDKLNTATFAKACSLLALSRAKMGDLEQAAAIYTAFASMTTPNDPTQQALLKETHEQLTALIQPNPSTKPGSNVNPANPNQGGTSGDKSALTASEERRIIRECDTLYKTRRFEQVDTKLTQLMNANPSSNVWAEAALLKGKALFELGKEREFLTLLETICDNYTTTDSYPDALWLLGLYYDSCGDHRANGYFQNLIDAFPNNKNVDGALYYLALEDIESGSSKVATRYLLRIYQNYQSGKYWSHATWALAYEAFKKKDYGLSEMYLQKILQHPPDSAVLDRTLYLRGELALSQKEYETAQIAFRDVRKLCPGSSLLNLADRNAQIATKSVMELQR